MRSLVKAPNLGPVPPSSMARTDSTTGSASLRKDDAIAANIINLLTSGRYKKTDDVCLKTNASKERIIARAKLALSDTNIDRDDLHHHREMSAKNKHYIKVQNHLKATGSSADEAATMLILKGSQATDYWDQVRHMAAKISMSRQTLIDAIRLYSDRNESVHFPPPTVEENIKVDGTLNWESILAECKAKKTSLEVEALAGQITREQRDQFKILIDEWLRLQQRASDKPSAATMIKHNAGLARLQLKPYPSFYKHGKWDDLDM
ncbi:hypothetical protein QBC46DRAFT_366332 [Diplogelasinospora grovesii]|uniref:Uncharacterized protein n=1 Tax=Diplogelasinospora grovesii TaxID=303347 RepID=A0AAN6S2C9_9PEZI|nr:hypothetical protein QBC46DRAFT_366332 [Diplogelasinospora grovesii]